MCTLYDRQVGTPVSIVYVANGIYYTYIARARVQKFDSEEK